MTLKQTGINVVLWLVDMWVAMQLYWTIFSRYLRRTSAQVYSAEVSYRKRNRLAYNNIVSHTPNGYIQILSASFNSRDITIPMQYFFRDNPHECGHLKMYLDEYGIKYGTKNEGQEPSTLHLVVLLPNFTVGRLDFDFVAERNTNTGDDLLFGAIDICDVVVAGENALKKK